MRRVLPLVVLIATAALPGRAVAQDHAKAPAAGAAAAPLPRPAIAMDAARRTALAAVPGGRVTKEEYEREAGKLIYSFDVRGAGRPGIEEIHVDANSGRIIAREHENDSTETTSKRPAAPAPANRPRP